MGEKTTAKETLPPDEVADRLEELAHQMRGDGQATVPVGNKQVTLSPADEVTYEVDVRERSPMLKKKRETVTLTFDWAVTSDD